VRVGFVDVLFPVATGRCRLLVGRLSGLSVLTRRRPPPRPQPHAVPSPPASAPTAADPPPPLTGPPAPRQGPSGACPGGASPAGPRLQGQHAGTERPEGGTRRATRAAPWAAACTSGTS